MAEWPLVAELAVANALRQSNTMGQPQFEDGPAMFIEIENKSEIYLKTKQVRVRYGSVSEAWIERRMKDAGFPQPIYFGHLRFWRESDLLQWERAQIGALKARPSRPMVAARAGKAVRQ
jgi:predicted DNA-binding transcriptional regulator AlpA